jgi:hypothetical protein
MREFFTTGELAIKSKLTRQHIWNLWIDGKLPAYLLNSGGKQLRFEKTTALEAWCVKSASDVEERLRKRQAREYRYWTKYHSDLLSRLVTRKQPRPYCDLAAWRMWKRLTVKNRLTLSELNESMRRGYVAKKKTHYGNAAGGVLTWQALSMQFKMLRRATGNRWKNWLPEKKRRVQDLIRPIVQFDKQLRG